MPLDQDLANKIASAHATVGGTPIRDGRYVMAVKSVMLKKTFKGDMFIAEFRVEEAEKTHHEIDPNPVGSSCSLALNLTSNVSAPGNAKQFVLGLLGLDEAKTQNDTVAKKIMECVEGDGKKVRGMLVYCETYRKQTKTGANAGKEGVYPRWSHVPEQTPQDIAARAADLE